MSDCTGLARDPWNTTRRAARWSLAAPSAASIAALIVTVIAHGIDFDGDAVSV